MSGLRNFGLAALVAAVPLLEGCHTTRVVKDQYGNVLSRTEVSDVDKTGKLALAATTVGAGGALLQAGEGANLAQKIFSTGRAAQKFGQVAGENGEEVTFVHIDYANKPPSYNEIPKNQLEQDHISPTHKNLAGRKERTGLVIKVDNPLGIAPIKVNYRVELPSNGVDDFTGAETIWFLDGREISKGSIGQYCIENAGEHRLGVRVEAKDGCAYYNDRIIRAIPKIK
jgi:hypothetical protein